MCEGGKILSADLSILNDGMAATNCVRSVKLCATSTGPASVAGASAQLYKTYVRTSTSSVGSSQQAGSPTSTTTVFSACTPTSCASQDTDDDATPGARQACVCYSQASPTRVGSAVQVHWHPRLSPLSVILCGDVQVPSCLSPSC